MMETDKSKVKSLFSAISFSDKSGSRYRFYYSDNLIIAVTQESYVPMCEHRHEEYEFFIPLSPNPYLMNEGALYFGEVGRVYPVCSNRLHGIGHACSNSSHIIIAINKSYFDSLAKDKPGTDALLNGSFAQSKSLCLLLELFEECFVNGVAERERLDSVAWLICEELLDCAGKSANDERKKCAVYQKGMYNMARYINEHFSEDLTLSKLAEISGLSANYFSSCFKKAIGDSPNIYLLKYRISKAKVFLEKTDMTVKEIAERCGFNHSNSFTGAFKRLTGMSPTSYRKQKFTFFNR